LTKSSLVDKVHNDQTRIGRAVLLYEEHGEEIEDQGDGIYIVPSSTGAGSYRVDYTNETCDCPDYEFHPEEVCKHILAVGISLAKRRTRGARSCFCDACGRVSGEVYEVQEDHEDHTHHFAGERLCASCARRGGVL
jgi:hypothetical protein